MRRRPYRSHVSPESHSSLVPALTPRRRHADTPIRFLALIAALATCSLAGCDSPGARADLVVLNGAEPESIDPAEITGQLDGRIAYALFEGLLHFDRFGHPQPGIAQSWDISSDGKLYTFHLRANARWSNGDPVTATDF